MKIAARYPIERTTPVTGLRTQELVTLIGLATASRTASRRIVGVEATGINACPCAQGLVRDQAAERLGEAGFEDADVERILELVPLATHNQRGAARSTSAPTSGSTRRTSSSWSSAR